MKLELAELSKSYIEVKALHQFSYTFKEGVYGLLGPNGAGKSTLMSIITDNLCTDYGSVLFNGKDVRKMGVEYLKQIGFMPQNQNLYPSFSGVRFMYYMASLKGLRKKESDEQIPKLLQKVNLLSDAKRKLGTFSGGMKQRILIAQALLGNPKLIIMDEPTAGLDPKERIRIRNLISEVSIDKIVLIATHVVTDVEFIAKEILLINKGELIESGTAEALENKIDGRVFEVVIDPEEISEIEKNYIVANMVSYEKKIKVRVLGKPDSFGQAANVIRPNLEDVYLAHFAEERVIGLC